MKRLGFLLILTQLLGTLARGDASPSLEAQWWQTKLGAPLIVSGPLFQQLDGLTALPEKRSQCEGITQPLLADLKQYAGLARERKARAAGRLGSALIDWIYKKIGPANPCFEQAVRTYFLGAVFISQPGFLQMREEIGLFDPIYGGDASARMLLEAVAFLRAGKIQFLTAGARAELEGAPPQGAKPKGVSPKGGLPSEGWNDPKLLGAYDCQSSSIYIDPRLRPFDLGATFVHELDHLVRDKAYSAPLLEAEFLAKLPGDRAWEAYLSADESFASVAGAFVQRINRISPFQITLSPYLFGIGKMKAKRETDTFRANQDLSFINTSGPLEKLFQTGQDWLIHFPVESLFTLSGPLQEDRAAFPGIVDVVHRGYFAGEPADAEISRLISSSVFDASVDTLLGFPADQKYYADALAGFDYAELQWKLLMSSGPGRSGVSAQSYAAIDALLGKMGKPSEVCKLYGQALDQGFAPNYIGRKYGSNRPGEHGTRPGEHGTRPSLSVRPCVHLSGL